MASTVAPRFRRPVRGPAPTPGRMPISAWRNTTSPRHVPGREDRPLLLLGAVNALWTFSDSLRTRREAHFPTQQPSSCQEARIPGPDGHSRWACRSQGPPCQGSGADFRVGPDVAPAGRLHGRSAFSRLRLSGQRVRSGPLSASVVFTGEAPRVGFAVPTSLGNAVVRNRLRRRLRAIAMAATDLPSADVVIRPSTRCIALSYSALQTALTELVARITALTPEPSAT